MERLQISRFIDLLSVFQKEKNIGFYEKYWGGIWIVPHFFENLHRSIPHTQFAINLTLPSCLQWQISRFD